MRVTFAAVRQLAGGLGTAVLALALMVWLVLVALACLVGVGLLVAPASLRAVHTLADRERVRLGRWGPEPIGPGPPPARLRSALADPTMQRELRWLGAHATLGLGLGFVGVLMPVDAIRDILFPLWWWMVPEGEASASLWFWIVEDWTGAFLVTLLGVGWLVLTVALCPTLARLQAHTGRRLLAPGPEVDLSLRIVELTATRAAALDAHAAELRRIERSLHDSTQNPLVAVTVLIGAARRALARDPSDAEVLLERAQGAAEQALTELRAIARGILPPVLADRGLAGALAGLAASCPVPCRVDSEVLGRCAASVEATAYFVASEALTNISRHSRARSATVSVRTTGGRLALQIADDGQGGADETEGTGLAGIRRRVEAHDGTLVLTSPLGGPTTMHVELPCG